MPVQLRGVADAYVFGVAGMEHRLDVETQLARQVRRLIELAGRGQHPHPEHAF